MDDMEIQSSGSIRRRRSKNAALRDDNHELRNRQSRRKGPATNCWMFCCPFRQGQEQMFHEELEINIKYLMDSPQ